MTSRYTVVLSKLAQEKFDRFFRTDRKLGEQLAKAIDRLAQHPELGKFLKGEWKGYRKYRSGNYRIIYRIERSRLIIYILTMDDRKDIYR
ncbi:MAG: type II toxin-antitoxin system RelE/ParE family toxin [Candidatus Omnitrophota bacterium]|nr:type II toxin-antitoxin system RelE/ParE family toxin [Candidatus Omnitrophota bacterium]